MYYSNELQLFDNVQDGEQDSVTFLNVPTNIFACCMVGLPAAGGSIVAAGVAT